MYLRAVRRRHKLMLAIAQPVLKNTRFLKGHGGAKGQRRWSLYSQWIVSRLSQASCPVTVGCGSNTTPSTLLPESPSDTPLPSRSFTFTHLSSALHFKLWSGEEGVGRKVSLSLSVCTSKYIPLQSDSQLARPGHDYPQLEANVNSPVSTPHTACGHVGMCASACACASGLYVFVCVCVCVRVRACFSLWRIQRDLQANAISSGGGSRGGGWR